MLMVNLTCIFIDFVTAVAHTFYISQQDLGTLSPQARYIIKTVDILVI